MQPLTAIFFFGKYILTSFLDPWHSMLMDETE